MSRIQADEPHGGQQRTPLKIASLYAMLGFLWILFSDQLAAGIFQDQETMTRVSMFKGWFYVLASAALLYGLVGQALGRSKAAELALRESERRYRLVTDKAADAIFLHDMEGRIIDLNQAACDSVGYTRQELLGMRVHDIAPLVQADNHRQEFWESLEPGKSCRFETDILRKDGSVWPVEVSLGPLELGGQRLILALARDISTRKLYQAKIERQNALLEGINHIYREALTTQSEEELGRTCLRVAQEITGSQFGFYGEISADGSYSGVAVNDSGWEACRMNDQPGHCPRSANLHLLGLFGQGLTSGQGFFTNDPANHAGSRGLPPGHPSVSCFLAVPLKRQGQTVGVLALANRPGGYGPEDMEAVEALAPTMVEVFSRARAEAALRAKNEELDRYFTSNLDLLCIADTKGYFRRLNPQWERALGYPLAQLEGASFMDLVHPEDQESTLEAVAILAGQNEIQNFTNRYRCQDGSYRWLEWRSFPMGELIYAAARDITAQRQAELALRHSEERFRLAFSTSPDAICLTRASDGALLEINQGFIEILGYTQEELAGKTSLEINVYHNPQDRQDVVDDLLKLGRVSNREIKFVCKDGHTITGLMSAVMLTLDGQPCVLSITRDIEKLKQDQAELRRWADAFQFCAHGMAIGLPGGNTFLACNPAFARMHGLKVEDITGRPILSAYHPAEHQRVLKHIAQADLEGQTQYETRMQRADGTVFPVQMDLVSVRGADGEIIYRVATVQDITRRLEDQEALAQSEELLRLAFEKTNSGIALVDLQGRILRVNAAFRRAFGYAADEYVGMSINHLTHPEDRKLGMEAMRRLTADPSESAVIQKRYLHRDGHVVWGQVSLALVRDAQGRPSYFISHLTDITERKLAEDALRESEERFRQIARLSREMVWEVDAQGLYTYLSGVSETVLGYKPEELVGKVHFYELHPLEGREEFKASALEVFQRRGAFQGLLNPALTKEGNLVWLSTNGAPIVNPDGSLKGYRGSDSDITERMKAQQERDRLEGQLIQAQKMEAIGTLAGGIAHDFNNILGAILGYAELAKDDFKEGGRGAADIEQIISAAERARNLVKQILTFSRKVSFQQKPLSLNNTVLQTLQMLEPTLPKMISIQTRLGSSLDMVLADPTQMEQVVLNLAANAQDAMPEGGRLMIETRNVSLDEEFCRQHREAAPGPYVLVQVSDTGQGMPPKVVERIFDPFFTTKDMGKGTGLGLSTVYGIVKAHGGYVYCHSELGAGAVFKVYLPAQRQSAGPAGGEEEQREQSLQGDERILLVDDEEPLRVLGSRTLGRAGYVVETAASGEEALRKYQTDPAGFAMVVMDMGMPGMGGHKAIKAILEFDPQARIVIASGYSPAGQVKASLEMGALGYVAKPFKQGELLATIRGVLDKN